VSSDLRTALEDLKTTTKSLALGVYDADLATLRANSESSAEAFWAIVNLSCCSIPWPDWYRELRWTASLEHNCECPLRHTIECRLLHRRWVFITLVDGEHALEDFSDETLWIARQFAHERVSNLLPKTRARRGGCGPEPAHAFVGIPGVWRR
jgi:hypothetical protein